MADNEKNIRSEEEKELIINARKPVGELGDKLLDRMNESHESLAQWGVSHLDISKDDVILDIGCGGGVNVERFLSMTENKVYGLDYSEIAVEKSTKLNQDAIDEGRCEVIQGSVSELPFEDNTFDITIPSVDLVYDYVTYESTVMSEGIVFYYCEDVQFVDNRVDVRYNTVSSAWGYDSIYGISVRSDAYSFGDVQSSGIVIADNVITVDGHACVYPVYVCADDFEVTGNTGYCGGFVRNFVVARGDYGLHSSAITRTAKVEG